jgi:hypothetical protein
MQDPFTILATRNLSQIKASNNHHNREAKRQTYMLKNINSKLIKGDSMTANADKGKTCVIIHTSDYTNKVQNFNHNNFQKLPKAPQINTKMYYPNIKTM